jgi:hypothetical protein
MLLEEFFVNFVEPHQPNKRVPGTYHEPKMGIKVPLNADNTEIESGRITCQGVPMTFADLKNPGTGRGRRLRYNRAIIEFPFFWYGNNQVGVRPVIQALDLVPEEQHGAVNFDDLDDTASNTPVLPIVPTVLPTSLYGTGLSTQGTKRKEPSESFMDTSEGFSSEQDTKSQRPNSI